MFEKMPYLCLIKINKSRKMNGVPHQPHDKFFKTAFSHPQVAKEHINI
ncbi:MAG: hypothetical protein RI894_1831, partial [Bacteroidota bacterium]